MVGLGSKHDFFDEASVRLGPKTLRTLDEEVKSLVSAWCFQRFYKACETRKKNPEDVGAINGLSPSHW